MAFLKNDVSDNVVSKIHQYSMKILHEKGVKFPDSRALDIFRKSGLKVDGEIVYFDEKFVMDKISNMRRDFTIKARDDKYDTFIGNSKTVFTSATGSPFVSRNNKRSKATKDDLVNFMKLTHLNKQLSVTNPLVVAPCDISIDKMEAYQQAVCLKYSTKPMMAITNGYEKTNTSVEMMKKVCDRGVDEYVTLGLISPISPLLYDHSMIGAMLALCENNQPIMITSAAIPAATSPVSLMGTMAVTSAEVIAGIIFTQILNPGIPVIYGNTTSSTDLSNCFPRIGAPTSAHISCITKAMAEFYGLPCRSGGCLSDAKQIDYQAGSESAFVLLATMACGTDYAQHGSGIFDTYKIIGYEKFILDEELLEATRFFLNKPNIDDDALGYQTIMDVPHGGQYLAEEHTLKYMYDEVYCTKVVLSGSYEHFEKENKTLLDKANIVVDERLSSYTLPEMDNSLSSYLEQFLSI